MMKKIRTLLVFCLVCAIVVCCLPCRAAAAAVGDADGDGRVTAGGDARLVLRASVGLDETDLARMDADADGEVSAADARLVLRFTVGLEPVLPVKSGTGLTNAARKEENALQMTINDTAVSVAWESNEAVTALNELAAKGPVTVPMTPYGGFEQVGALGNTLPSNDASITTEAGDIVLYNGNQIVVFYGSNSWRYTRLGKIQGLDRDALKALLGNGAVTLTLSSDNNP